MKVKELIERLLEENMDAEVLVATTDESRRDETSTEKNNVAFNIKEVEHWCHSVYIGFTDWRKRGVNVNLQHSADFYKKIADTMHKYQKIEQIANNKNINGDLLRMSEIRRVLKDGNERTM